VTFLRPKSSIDFNASIKQFILSSFEKAPKMTVPQTQAENQQIDHAISCDSSFPILIAIAACDS
jgi:hypothetical protein